mgnify:CR=1 FL=1
MITVPLQRVVALSAGILILRMLNYRVAVYLFIAGRGGSFGNLFAYRTQLKNGLSRG